MFIPCRKTFLLPRSKSPLKVKVKYQGFIFQITAVTVALVFHKDSLLIIASNVQKSLPPLSQNF